MMMVPSELFAIAFRFTAACALALWAAAAPAATILVYGDSLSAGYGLPSGRDWASLLAGRLREVGLNYKVANASISGETTVGGKNRIAASLKQHQPDVVILALGANDGLRGGSLDEMRANLETIVDATRNSGARVLLVGMRLPPNYGAAYTEKFRNVYGEVAASRKVPLVPFMFEGFSEKRAYFLPDTVHPAADAQPIILETVWKGLRPLLKKS
jgi:acyl-CoA thioesterase-1